MENHWLFPYRAFDIAAFLRAIKSPRLQDVPEFAEWIGDAARQYDIRPEWLLGLSQKEQSFLTRRGSWTGWQRALLWTMGFGATEGGDLPGYAGTRNQIFAAASGLRRYMTPGDSLYCGDRVGKQWRDLDGQTGTVPNLAAACALQYTPHWSTLQTVERIWRELGFEEQEATEVMSRIAPPLRIGPAGFGERYNVTLHGRSVYRPRDVPGHNVFKGYGTWAANGHRGVGDGLDCFGPGGTPVYAMHDGVQTRWANDVKKLEVIYVEGGGVTTVYAHIDASHEGTGMRIKRGELVGRMRGDLVDPHLHLEVWIDGTAVSGGTATAMAGKLIALCGDSPAPARELKIVLYPPTDAHPYGEVVDCHPEIIDGVTRGDVRPVADALGYDATLGADGKVYLTPQENRQP